MFIFIEWWVLLWIYPMLCIIACAEEGRSMSLDKQLLICNKSAGQAVCIYSRIHRTLHYLLLVKLALVWQTTCLCNCVWMSRGGGIFVFVKAVMISMTKYSFIYYGLLIIIKVLLICVSFSCYYFCLLLLFYFPHHSHTRHCLLCCSLLSL